MPWHSCFHVLDQFYIFMIYLFLFFLFLFDLCILLIRLDFLFYQPGNIHFSIISNVTNVVLFIIGFDSYIVRVYLCLKYARGKPACFHKHKFHLLFT